MKKIDQGLVATLTRVEIQALMDAPDPHTLSGTRDRAMLHLAFAAGLRGSELIGLRVDQFDAPGAGQHPRHGQGPA
jgi:integrase/recombinase XerD